MKQSDTTNRLRYEADPAGYNSLYCFNKAGRIGEIAERHPHNRRFAALDALSDAWRERGMQYLVEDGRKKYARSV